MKMNIQDVDSIAPVAEEKSEQTVVDPVQEDYDKGKQALENNELAQAAVFFHNAMVGYEEKGDEHGVANSSNQLAHVCLQREDFEKALVHYQRAWNICEKENDLMSLVAIKKQFVLVYRSLKQYDKAVNYALELLDQHSGNNDPANGVAVLEQLADIYQEKGDLQKAADSYRLIASIHKSFNHENIAKKFDKKADELV